MVTPSDIARPIPVTSFLIKAVKAADDAGGTADAVSLDHRL
jgi:hypothetical protein